MTMHLEGPWLSTTGKKKGKVKYASADAKRQAEALKSNWESLLKKYDVKDTSKTRARDMKGSLSSVYTLKTPPGREVDPIASRDTGWQPCTKGPDKVYTGTMIKGIGTMHKSNAVPIFSDEEAVAIATMRR